MEHLTIPKGYESALNLHETQVAIKVGIFCVYRLLCSLIPNPDSTTI